MIISSNIGATIIDNINQTDMKLENLAIQLKKNFKR